MTATTPTAEADARLVTIRNLLAKAEATQFPAEAEAFTAKASELIARYAIDEALLWSHRSSGDDVPEELRLVLHRPFTALKAVLVGAVAEVFGCQVVRLGAIGDERSETVSVVGFRSDLTMVETLVTSLFLQLTTAMTASGAAPGARTASQVAAWRRSFISGFTHTVAERLRAEHTRARDEADAAAPDAGNASTALVLRDRAEAVRDDFRQRYPRIRTSRVSTGTSGAGHRAGQQAGRTADLGARGLGRRDALPKGA